MILSPLDNVEIPRYNSAYYEHAILRTSQIFQDRSCKTPPYEGKEVSPGVGGDITHCPIYS